MLDPNHGGVRVGGAIDDELDGGAPVNVVAPTAMDAEVGGVEVVLSPNDNLPPAGPVCERGGLG